MAGAVRIQAKALSDTRFKVLAKLCGLADQDHALIKCARIWAWQTEFYSPESPTYEVPEDIIDAELGPGGANHLVTARLATRSPGGYRMHGTEGEIEWLYKARQNGRKHTRKSGERDKSQPPAYPPGQPPAQPGGNPLSLSLSPSGSQTLSTRASSGIARRIWTRHLEAFNRLRPEGVPAMQDRLGSAGERNIAALLPELMGEFKGDEKQVESLLEHVLAVGSSEAKTTGSVQYLDEDMWQPHRFRKARVRKPGEVKPVRNENQQQPPARKFRVLP